MTVLLKSIGLFAGIGLASGAAAQDFFMAGTSPMDYNQIQSASMQQHIANLSTNRLARVQASRAAPRSGLAAAARGTPEAVETGYRVTTSESRQALDAYVSRIARKNPQAARLTGEQFRKYDASRLWRGIVQPFGLRDGDVADQLTSYMVLGYMITTGDTDPSAAAVAAARRQIVQKLAENPRVTAPATRAALGEELKLLFVTLHAGWQSARREGTLTEYSRGIAALWRAQGDDLRGIRLTDAGFVQR